MLDQSPAPFQTIPLHEFAYRHLSELLMTGCFRPGEALTLRSAADALGTSIMPVREAVRRLVSEGALEMPTSRSIRVPFPSVVGFEDLCAARMLVEGEAAALAAERRSGQSLDKILVLNEEYRGRLASGDMHETLRSNRSLHFAVYGASGSLTLLRLIETLWLRGGPFLSLLVAASDSSGVTASVDNTQHDLLIEALKSRDSGAARAAISRDIRHTAEIYLPQIRALERGRG